MVRKSPTSIGSSSDRKSPEEEMVCEMNSALYALSDEMREVSPRAGADLLPAGLEATDPKEKAEAKIAKSFVRKLYAAFKSAKKEKK